MPLYPLKFVPRLIEKIWGGRNLQSVLHKRLPTEKPYGESWELYDFPPGVVETGPVDKDQWVSSIVTNGPLAGKSLHDIVQMSGADLMGDVPLINGNQFPILIKFLDARDDLSLQVHPPLAYTQNHPGTNLKTECWYVLEHDKDAKLYRGLMPGVSREQFAAGIDDGSVMQLVKALPVKPGDCFFLPSGTVHALGAGILVAEVQTPSDTTFRVWDFNRLENGTPRTLHVPQALECIDFSHTPQPPQTRSHTAGVFTTVTRLITCEYFNLEKVRFTEGIDEPVPYDQPVAWIMLQGKAQIKVDDVAEPTTITAGETVLLPARMNNPKLKTITDCVWLETTFGRRLE